MKYLVHAGARPFTVEAPTGTDALVDVKETIRTSEGSIAIGQSLRDSLARNKLNFIVIRISQTGEREAVVCGELAGDVQSPVTQALVDAFKHCIPQEFFDHHGRLLRERNVEDKCKFFDFVNTLF